MYTVPMMPTCCEEMPKAAAFVANQTQPATPKQVHVSHYKRRR
jgi:hypothetical protein